MEVEQNTGKEQREKERQTGELITRNRCFLKKLVIVLKVKTFIALEVSWSCLNSPPVDLILSQMNLSHIFTHHSSKTNFNIILSPLLGSVNYLVPSGFRPNRSYIGVPFRRKLVSTTGYRNFINVVYNEQEIIQKLSMKITIDAEIPRVNSDFLY